MTPAQFEELKALLVKTNRWAVFGFTLGTVAVFGGCMAYVQAVNAPLWAIILRQQKDIDALQEIQSMQMADPKWFNKIEAQNQAIREWKKNHVNAND